MRSPIGPVLVIFGLAMTVVLVLVLFQNMGMRSDLETARADVAELRTAVESIEPGVTDLDLDRQLGQLEVRIRDWLISTGGSPTTGSGGGGDVSQRLDAIIDQIEALDGRLDEICENVPVC